MNKTTVCKFLSSAFLTLLSAQAAAIDVEPGLYQFWRSDVEVSNTQALGKPQSSFCVTAAAARDPVILIGANSIDAGCSATTPQRSNSVTSVFNLTCNGGQSTGTGTAVKSGQKFTTTISLRRGDSLSKSYIYASRVAACTR
jgi:Protein of unknown function (DUF3617)